MNMESAVIQE